MITKKDCASNGVLDDVTYIITAPKSKRNSVLVAIELISQQAPSLRFIYAEQFVKINSDEVSEKNEDIVFQENRVTHLKLPLSQEGDYDKLWGWNCAAKIAKTEYVVVAEYELVPQIPFLIECISTLQATITSIYAVFASDTQCDVKSYKGIKGISPLNLSIEDKNWLSSPVFIATIKKDWEKGGGFFERNLPAELKPHVITNFLEFNKHARVAFQGTFYYDKNCEEDYTHLFNANALEPRYNWLINEKGESFFKFNKCYNSLLGWGSPSRFTAKSVDSKVDEIRKIVSSSTVYKEVPGKFRNLVIAITTYQRIDYLHDFLKTFLLTRNIFYNWNIIIADDGSSDGTLSYITKLKDVLPELTLISNNRSGVAHQTNTIFRSLQNIEFDCCFKCDDDILFLKPGWEDIYLSAIHLSGQQHLCHYSNEWKASNFQEEGEMLVAHSDILGVQGAFFTITPEIIKKIGFFDEISFGLRGWAHIDYSARCCRAGLAGSATVMDVKNSNDYIILNYDPMDYKSSLSIDTIYNLVDGHNKEEKQNLIVDKNRVRLPYEPSLNVYDQAYLLNLHKSALTNQNKIIEELKAKLSQKESEEQDFIFSLDESQDSLSEVQKLEKAVKELKKRLISSANVENELNYKLTETLGNLDIANGLNADLCRNIAQEIEIKDIIKSWYHKEYEVLPLWFKRFGHIIKLIKGQRTVF